MTGIGGWTGLAIVGRACAMLLVNPLLYVATVALLVDLWRNVRVERQVFGVRVTRIWKPYVYRQLTAIVVGLVLSVIGLLVGIDLRPGEIATVAGLTLLLGFVQTRFASSPFVISLFVCVAWLARKSPTSHWPPLQGAISYLQHVQLAGWLAVAALACFGQMWLLLWHRHDGVAPALLASRRGKHVGGYKFQLGFIVPLATWTQGSLMLPTRPAHWPWLGGVALHVGLAALPLLVGVHALTLSPMAQRVRQQLWRFSALSLLWYVGGAVVALRVSLGLGAGMALCGALAQEWLLFAWRRRDNLDEAVCAPTDEGVVVLYTIKGSLAEQMGLRAGEIITHVNQVPVHSEYDLHFAIDQNPAYARLQVMDVRGELRLVGKPVYTGARHQLGVVVMSPHVDNCFRKPCAGLLQTIYTTPRRLSPTIAVPYEAEAMPPPT